MKHKKTVRSLATHYRIGRGNGVRLRKWDPADTAGLSDEFKEESDELLERSTRQLAELQDMLYAQDRWSLLLIFQAMDAGGKDGTIKHVMSGVNPQGCEVNSFKAPSAEEIDHDFLWRTSRRMPPRGKIGIFNRSYYEEVLVVRMHPELLSAQRLPDVCVSGNIWKQRFEDILGFERYAARNGTVIRKFFLNISAEEQKQRFLARLDVPEKNWKFSAADVRERRHWNDYMRVYEDMIRNTATSHAPWYVVPANHKWFARLVVSSVIVDTLQHLRLSYPKVSKEKRQSLAAARRELEGGSRAKSS